MKENDEGKEECGKTGIREGWDGKRKRREDVWTTHFKSQKENG